MLACNTVKERMIERGQEPYIAEKMKSLMEQENFQVTHCVKKDTFPGTPIFLVFTMPLLLSLNLTSLLF